MWGCGAISAKVLLLSSYRGIPYPPQYLNGVYIHQLGLLDHLIMYGLDRPY